MDIYVQQGYKDRHDYLHALAEVLEVDPRTVFQVAAMLGASEDFDGLVTTLEDYTGD